MPAAGYVPGTIATAVGVFAGTDVDDLLVLTSLFLAGRATGKPSRMQIVLGQYLGIAALVAASAVAAVGLLVVPDRWIGLLGLVPIVLGVRGLILAMRATSSDRRPHVAGTGLTSVAVLTIANGADNLSVYVPLFRHIGLADTLLTIVVFAVMVAVWLAVASWLGSHPLVVRAAGRMGHWLVPIVFLIIGTLILLGARPTG